MTVEAEEELYERVLELAHSGRREEARNLMRGIDRRLPRPADATAEHVVPLSRLASVEIQRRNLAELLARAMKLLRKPEREWVMNHERQRLCCPDCLRARVEGHLDDCEFAAVQSEFDVLARAAQRR